MKILKIILVLIVLLVVTLVGIGLFTKSQYHFTRSIEINADKTKVWNVISSFNQFKNWSPWNKLDSAMKVTISTPDNQVGSTYSWEGNDKAGTGSMNFLTMSANDSFTQEIKFVKPFKSTSNASMKLKEENGKTTVTWAMYGENGFIARIFMTLMGGIDKAVGKDYEEGLNNLKKLVESMPSEPNSKYEVKMVDFSELHLACVENKNFSFSKIDSTLFSNGFGIVAGHLASNKIESNYGAYSVFKNYNETTQTSDIYIGMSVKAHFDSKDKVQCLNIPNSKAIMVEYYGDYSKTGDAYGSLMQYEKEKDLKIDYAVEHYVTDPKSVNYDYSKVLTKIYFVIK